MTGVANQQAVHSPKAGGHPRLMFVGAAAVAGSMLVFLYTQKTLNRNRDDIELNHKSRPNWQHRHGQQRPDMQGGPKVANLYPYVEPSKSAPQIPLPTSNDSRSEDIASRIMSFIAGKGIFPDPTVPQNIPRERQVPIPQRKHENGTVYTKAGNYKDGYKTRPSGYSNERSSE